MKQSHTQNTNTQQYQNVIGSIVVYWQGGIRKSKTVSALELSETLNKLSEAKKNKQISEYYHWKIR